jgi:hypothetical protein
VCDIREDKKKKERLVKMVEGSDGRGKRERKADVREWRVKETTEPLFFCFGSQVISSCSFQFREIDMVDSPALFSIKASSNVYAPPK